MTESYDYIVVGAGSSGCVVAAELAKDPALRVLLLECGPDAEEHPEVLDADGYKYAFANDAVIWDRFSQKQPSVGKQRLFHGSGRGLGGSGSVNGMVYTRGAREDWDEWPEGWRWDEIESDFGELEATLRPHRREPTRFNEACIAAAETEGFTRSADLNNGDMTWKIGYEWMNYEGDRRRSSYVAFIRDAPRRDNLEIQTGARVHRVLLARDGRDGNGALSATGVRVERAGEVHDVAAAREVILCAGALETPKLLMLSGIGPRARLDAVGVECQLDAPEIGRNFQDHPNVTLFYRGKEEIDSFYPQLYSFCRANPNSHLPASQSDTCLVYWPARSAMKEAAQRMLPGKALPPALFNTPAKGALRAMVRGAFALGAVERAVEKLFGIVVILGKPKSRGELWLASDDPHANAILDPRWFTDDEDMETMLKGIDLAGRIASADPLAERGASPLMPGKKAFAPAAPQAMMAR